MMKLLALALWVDKRCLTIYVHGVGNSCSTFKQITYFIMHKSKQNSLHQGKSNFNFAKLQTP